MPLPPSPMKAQRVSWSEQAFALRYGAALHYLRNAGFELTVGPVEPLPPDAGHYPRLARYVQQSATPWRWISVSHRQAGLLGQLALFYEGSVRDESGRELSDVSLLNWGARQLRLSARRVLHQNRLNIAINERTRAVGLRELPWVRAGAVLAGLGLLAATGTARAINEEWLRPGNDFWYWVALAAGMALSSVAFGLGFRWWQLHLLLKMKTGEDASPERKIRTRQ